MKTLLTVVLLTAAAFSAACSGAPGEQGLRDSFAQHSARTSSSRSSSATGDDMTFVGPGPEGGTAKWRVHIDSGVIEPNDDAKMPYKGTIHSSWYADGQKVQPSATESHLPYELTTNGLSQDPWAFWDPAGKKWDW